MLSLDLLFGHAVGGDDSNGVDLAGLGNEGFGSRGIEQNRRGAAHRVGVAERGDAGDGELLGCPAWSAPSAMSPTWMPPVFAECRSMTISSGRLGA